MLKSKHCLDAADGQTTGQAAETQAQREEAWLGWSQDIRFEI